MGNERVSQGVLKKLSTHRIFLLWQFTTRSIPAPLITETLAGPREFMRWGERQAIGGLRYIFASGLDSGEQMGWLTSLCHSSEAYVGLVSVGSDTRNHGVAQKCSCVPKRHRSSGPACPWEVEKPTWPSLIRSFSLSPPAFTHPSDHPCIQWVACLHLPCMRPCRESGMCAHSFCM